MTEGSILIQRPERQRGELPAPQSLESPTEPQPPAAQGAHRAEVLASMVASLSGVGFAVMSHNTGYLILALVVLLGTLSVSVGVRAGQRRRTQQELVMSQACYAAEMDAQAALVERAGTAQRAALNRTYPAPQDILQVIRDEGAIWERRASDDDFAVVRLGLGSVPAKVAIAGVTTLGAAPGTAKLAGVRCLAVVGDLGRSRPLVRSWIAQLAAFHSPADLRILAAASPDALLDWEWAKWLPHTQADHPNRAARHVTDSPQEIFEALRERSSSAFAVLVIDDYPGDPQLDQIIGGAEQHAATVIALCATSAGVPPQCDSRVDLEDDGTIRFYTATGDQPAQDLVAEPLKRTDALRIARWLAARRVPAASELLSTSPVRLIDVLVASPDVSTTTANLTTPIGLSSSGQPLLLNLRESAAGGIGPHGILIGATGSGKSELLRSLVLGLCNNNSPKLFTTLLIDFKGGAAFRDLAALPHTAGLVTNLSDHPRQIDRVQAALSGEIGRRQRFLRDAGGFESIQQYQSRTQNQAAEALPYLLVVVDEFGELLATRPEFLEIFTTIGRLGRSLGIQLLLASQRLDEGRLRGLESHLSYRLALRTFTAAESHAVLGVAAAAELAAVPGAGYLAADGILTQFRAATTCLPPTKPLERSQGPVVGRFTVGQRRPAADSEQSTDRTSQERDLDELVAAISGASKGNRARSIWLPPLPETLSLEATPIPVGSIAVGLIDDPPAQQQLPLILRLFDQDAHVALIGATGSGRSTFLRTVAESLARSLPPERVQFYVLDLGGALESLAKLPHTGAVVGRAETTAIKGIAAELAATIDDRAKACRAAGCATFADLLRHQDRRRWLPDPLAAHLVVFIDGVGMLRAEHPEVDHQLAELASVAAAYGVHFVVAANRWSDLRPGLLDVIETRLELWLSDPADSRFGRAHASGLPRIPGRGWTSDGREIQFALANTARPIVIGAHRAPQIEPLPGLLPEPKEPLAQSKFQLGVQEHRLQQVEVNLLESGAHLLVFGDGKSGRTTVLRRILRHLDQAGARIHLVDPGRTMLDEAELPAVAQYAYDHAGAVRLVASLAGLLTLRQPPGDMSPRDLAGRDWWSGPEQVLVIDDYDLLIGPAGSVLTELSEHIRGARDLGFHVVLARRIVGAARSAFEPGLTALRGAAATGLVLSGDRAEGPLIGEVSASRQPPGRGVFVASGQRPVLVQTYWDRA